MSNSVIFTVLFKKKKMVNDHFKRNGPFLRTAGSKFIENPCLDMKFVGDDLVVGMMTI